MVLSKLLQQLVSILHYLSFFPDPCLFNEMMQILKHLETIFMAYRLYTWQRIVQQIRVRANPKWIHLKLFAWWKFRWIQRGIRRQIQSLSDSSSSLPTRLHACSQSLLMDAYFELDQVRRVLLQQRPILSKIILKHFFV